MSDDSLQVVLKYGTPQHKRVLEMIRSRKKASQAKMSQYYTKWDDADDAFRAYQPVSEKDADRRMKRKVLGQHDYTTVTVPYTFATIMTAHTYWTKVFLSRSPVYQLQGRHGETQDSIEAFEAVLDYQRMVGGHLVPLYNWIFDMAKYGLGIQSSYWDRQEAFISRKIQKPATLMGVPLQGQMETTWEQQNILKFEGNCIYNVRPYDWYPDPRVAINNFQAGEFCGRDTQVGWHEIVEGLRQGYYFNVDELAKRMNTGQYEREYGGSARVELPEQVNQAEGETKISGPGFAMLHEMTIRIVPSMLKLSPSSRTEKWCFTVANDDVIIGARPQGMVHDEFPFDIMEFGFGGHEFLKMNLVEVMLPLVDTISWLLNSHFYNVRKTLNDQKVVDPSRIVMKDLTSPIERGIIRLKPEAYGTPVQQAVHQLITPDVTQTHIRDIAVMEQILQRITGVVDELFGMSAGPDRESATGVRTRTGFAANRLMTVAEYNSALGFGPMMQKFISNTQQFMSTEQKFKIAGPDGMAHAKRFVNVNQEMIAGQYDFIPVDGSLPIDRLAQANFWKELTMQIAASPYANQFSILDMVGHIMRLQGEKNVDRFRLDLKPPEEIAAQVQAGNLVPIGGQGGGNRRPATGSAGATV